MNILLVYLIFLTPCIPILLFFYSQRTAIRNNESAIRNLFALLSLLLVPAVLVSCYFSHFMLTDLTGTASIITYSFIAMYVVMSILIHIWVFFLEDAPLEF